MKWVFFLCILFAFKICVAQDSTFRVAEGSVELKRIGIGKEHTVEGKYNKQVWISGKVKRVNYEYSYIPNYNTSTPPMYTDNRDRSVKVKSLYLVPSDDIVINYYTSGKVLQTFSKDSLILRSYNKNGLTRDIYYFNSKLQVDSIFRYYENGNLKTRILGTTEQPEDNLVLHLYHVTEIGLRNRLNEWDDHGMLSKFPVRTPFSYSSQNNILIYPKIQEYCHGNGIPQLIIRYFPDSVGAKTYHPEYEFFNPNGNPIEGNFITRNHAWNGVKYSYFDSGILESISERKENSIVGKYERWDDKGDRMYIEYRSGRGRDSIVFFKRLNDSIFVWRPPTHFNWFSNDTIKELKHPHCTLQFKPDGSLYSYKFEDVGGSIDDNKHDKNVLIEYYGKKDSFGFPHGRWWGINSNLDTVFDVHFHHGFLHGNYIVHAVKKNNSWFRSLSMGLDKDSSVRLYKGELNTIHYYSETGATIKTHSYYNGKIRQIDTLLYSNTNIALLKVHSDGWDREVSVVDTAKKTIYTRVYFAKDSLESEKWSLYHNVVLEWKKYHTSTGTIKEHWKDQGIEKRSSPNLLAPDQPDLVRIIRIATKWTYDQNGALIKTENYENGVLVGVE